MTMKFKTCPFCGSANLKPSARQTRGMKNHYIVQVFCLKCGARGPIVKSQGKDWREHFSNQTMSDLAEQAFEAFTTVAEKETANSPEDFKLEP